MWLRHSRAMSVPTFNPGMPGHVHYHYHYVKTVTVTYEVDVDVDVWT
jgi:hypothetical protein